MQVGELEGLLEEARAYQLAALGFMYPGRSWLAAMEKFLDARNEDTANKVPQGENLLKSSLKQSLDQHALEGIEREHNHLFTATANVLIPVYETEYGMDTVFAKTKELADLNGFYLAFGVELGKDANGERPDHLGIELEFMATLLIKEAYARNEGWDDKANVCLEGRKKFLKDHIGRWGPTFCTMLNRKTEVEFYKTLAGLTADLINKNLKDLNVKPGYLEPYEKIIEKIREESPDNDPNECPIGHEPE
ncbi:MAG: TorD/DmsD family molecular chaperone [Nitrososphaerales archaeon]